MRDEPDQHDFTRKLAQHAKEREQARQRENTPQELKRQERLNQLKAAMIPAPDLLKMDIPDRPKLLGEWMREGDFGIVFAKRGEGKTWLSMLIGKAVSTGEGLGEWLGSGDPRRVVYLDAEMNLADLKGREECIGIENNNFIWLPNEVLANGGNPGFNIASQEEQAAISSMLEEGDVFIIDNLSTAASGMSENDNDAWDMVKGWFLELRHRKITVILVHHAGKNGDMRGASRREDMTHWILRMESDHKEKDGDNLAFITKFPKCRNCPTNDAGPVLRWVLNTSFPPATIQCEKRSGPDAMLELIREGIDNATDLAEELGVSKGTIAKWAKKLNEAGKIDIKYRKYLPIKPDQ